MLWVPFNTDLSTWGQSQVSWKLQDEIRMQTACCSPDSHGLTMDIHTKKCTERCFVFVTG